MLLKERGLVEERKKKDDPYGVTASLSWSNSTSYPK